MFFQSKLIPEEKNRFHYYKDWKCMLKSVLIIKIWNFHNARWSLQHIYTYLVNASAIDSNIWPRFPTQDAWASASPNLKILSKITNSKPILRERVWKHKFKFTYWVFFNTIDIF
jgi:hypothetical protein